jgi:hypothetical protein
MSDMKKGITFVSCVKTKSTTRELAENLYISPWFRMASEWARRNSDRWFILSAEYGLLDPRTLVDPYERSLNKMHVGDRFYWSERVVEQIDDLKLTGARAWVLAGKNYRRFLMDPLEARFDRVSIPMEGLQMGQQLSWLKNTLGG